MFESQKPYQAGHSAYYVGKLSTDNPHKSKSSHHTMWYVGWNAAFDEDHQLKSYDFDPTWFPKRGY